METRTTYCRICEAACGLLADVEDGDVVALRPDKDHVVSRGFVCAKGTRFTEVHRDPDRVDHPLERVGGELRRTSWDHATERIGLELKRIRNEHGPHAVAVYIGNPSAFSYAMPLVGMGFVKALGTRNYYNAGSLDCNNKFVVARRMLGSPASQPVPDLDHAKLALLVGTNPSVSQSSFVNAPRFVERLRAIEGRGGRVLVVDPRRTETARSVGRYIPITPDTDAAFLLALVHVILAEGRESSGLLQRYSHGLGDLRRAVERFSPDAVAPATGIPPQTIAEIARAFAEADGAFCHVSTGVNQGTFGTLAYAAKIALETITGNLDRRGGALMPRGAADITSLARRFGIDREPQWRSRIGSYPTVVGALPCSVFADEVLTPGEGQIRALVVIGGNPLLSMPGGDRLREAMSRLELVVSLDLFVNDTAAYADYVLPATDWLERDDVPMAQLQLQPTPYVQWTDAVVEPRAERRPEWRVLFDLARAGGVSMFGSRAADLAARAAIRVGGAKAMALPALVPALGPRVLQKLRANPHGILVDRERPGDFLERRIGTPSKRVELHPDDVYERLDELEASLASEPAPGVKLRLISKRERLGHNSWMHNNSKLKTAKHRAFLSPQDAARLGASAGDRVRIRSQAAEIVLPVEITADVVPGAVAITHGYGHHDGSSWTAAKARGGVNVNALAPTGPHAADPISGMSQLVGVVVELERIASNGEVAAQ